MNFREEQMSVPFSYSSQQQQVANLPWALNTERVNSALSNCTLQVHSNSWHSKEHGPTVTQVGPTKSMESPQSNNLPEANLRRSAVCHGPRFLVVTHYTRLALRS